MNRSLGGAGTMTVRNRSFPQSVLVWTPCQRPQPAASRPMPPTTATITAINTNITIAARSDALSFSTPVFPICYGQH